MLNNPEERRQIRRERAVQRKAQSKKLLIRLSVAAVVLISCGVLIFALSRKTPQSDISESTPPVQSDPTVGSTAPTLPPTTVIHYAAAGDLNINELTVNAGGSGYLYTNAFLDVAHLLGRADVSSVNFEGNLCGAPYGSTHSAPQSMAEALQRAGVDLVQMANSYSINRGLSGLVTSIDAIRSAGMEPLGVYATNAEFRESKGYTIRNVQGVKIAFVAFTKGMDGMALPAGNENCVNVLYTDYDSAYQQVDTGKITSILSAAQKEKPDIIIALLHWGSEFNNTISKSQKDIVELMQGHGVDAIIGTHSHYVQKIDFDPANGKVVAYSLGDFFSDAGRAGSEYSVVLDLEITKDNTTGKAKITNCTYTPIFTVREGDEPLRILRLQEAIVAYENSFLNRVSADTYSKMTYAMQRIEARVKGE